MSFDLRLRASFGGIKFRRLRGLKYAAQPYCVISLYGFSASTNFIAATGLENTAHCISLSDGRHEREFCKACILNAAARAFEYKIYIAHHMLYRSSAPKILKFYAARG
nr:hypothetical protein [uncultured Campylobacter sp.]